MEFRNQVTNEEDVPITVWIEPWGEDYTLLPQESVVVVAEHAAEEFYFHWFVSAGKIVIYAEGDQDATVSVYQEGKRLECGHHRGVNAEAIPLGPGTLDGLK